MNSDKYLKKVFLASDVYAACLQHALTTEKEEVMGLLIGEVDENKCISHISACVILHRSDKQPDRVEISPEQLCTASEYAEKLACKLGKPLRVLGWYHSHPHITVWPSHVDVRTQAMYQTMDALFVGVIFSVYQNDTGAVGNHVQVTCFQAVKTDSEYQRREIELVVENTFLREYNLESIASLPRILSQEEVQSHEGGEGPDENNIVEDDDVDNTTEDELALLHNDAFKTLSLVHIVSKVAKPLCEDLEARLQSVNLRIRELENIKKGLLEKLN